MSQADQTRGDEDFDGGFYDLPDPEVRAKMSPQKLAILLSQLDAKTPAYILLSHELNIRLAQEAAKLSHRSAKFNAAFTVIGAIIGAIFTTILTSQTISLDCKAAQNCCSNSTAPPSVIINNNHALGSPPAVGEKAPTPPEGKQNNTQ